MLTRLYIDNFRCLVKFEYCPARKQLILGSNGSGKTTMLDALFFLRQFGVTGTVLDKAFLPAQRTRWIDQADQTFEIEAILDKTTFQYRVVIEPSGDPPEPRVSSETVRANGELVFAFAGGNVQLYDNAFKQTTNYPFDSARSALATIGSQRDNAILTKFRIWFGTLLCFRINPFDMGPRSDSEMLYPDARLTKFASWYRHLVQANPNDNSALLESLRSAMDDFGYLGSEPFGENVRMLFAEFHQDHGTSTKLYFNELSDGQRCLVCLYTILHYVLEKGSTVILDEADNFLALREIQPWLMRASEIVEDGKGQILLISHHPEVINQWAPKFSVEFVRDGGGPTRVQEFRGDPQSPLTPAELVARGWERG